MTVAIETMTDAQAATLFAAQVRSASFSATVPLDGNKVMAAQTVSSVIAFTPGSSPVLGAQAYVRLTANGTNAPTFAGFTEHGSSAGYLNTTGVVNLVRFWYDGTTAFFAVSQALNAVPFVMQSAAVANSAPTLLVLDFGRALNTGIVPALSAFSIAVTTGSAAALSGTPSLSGTTVTLTINRSLISTDVLSVTYTAPGSNPVTDGNGNVAGSSTIAVTNNVAAGGGGSVSYLRLPNLRNGMTEPADGGGGYDYVPTTDVGGYGSSDLAYSTLRLSSGQDGGFYGKVGAGVATAAAGPIFGLGTVVAPTSFSDMLYGIYASSGANWNILGSGSTAVNTVAVAANDLAGLFRTGTGMAARVSKDGGNTWTTVATWTGVTTAAMTASVQSGANGTKGTIYQPVKTGTWA